MLNIQHDFLLLSIVPDKRMDGVTMGNPANETRVRGKGNNRVAFNAVGRMEGKKTVNITNTAEPAPISAQKNILQ